MNLNRLDLNLLVALDALLSEQSVTRAANRSFVSQPAMSGALTRLREHFQDELVVRVGRSMVLTPFGASLAPRVSELLANLNTLVRSRPGFDPQTTDRIFTVVASEYLLSVFMPLVTRKVLSLAPGVVINIPLRNLDFEQRLAAGQIDMALTIGGLALADHPTTTLFQDDYVCIVWEGNTRVGDHLTRDTFLAQRQAVRAMARDNTFTVEESWVNSLGWQRQVALRVPTFEALPGVIVGTDLLAPMQRRMAEIAQRSYPIRILPHPASVPPLLAVLQWPTFRGDDSGNRWLRELIVNTAHEAFGPIPAVPPAAGTGNA